MTLQRTVPQDIQLADSTLKAVRDPERLRVLRNLELLDTEVEQAFDRLTRLASTITRSPIALVSFVDEDRQFFKSLLGLPDEIAQKRETPLSHSFCKHVVADHHELIVEDARVHPLVKDNLAIRDFNVIAYLGIPLTTKNGVALGSFCVIDTKPRRWLKEDIKIMRELAMLTMTEIELRAQIRARRKAEKDRDNLVNMIVHDLRTPLSVIMGTLELLQMSIDSSEVSLIQHELVDQGHYAAYELNGLIDDLLTLNKSESGQLNPFLTVASIAQYLREQEQKYQTQAQLENKHFALQIPSELPKVSMDKRLINRVLDNLISNAFKYSAEGQVVTLTAVHHHDEVKITVADHGVGIPEKYHKHIFEKFAQVKDANGQPLRKGSGVGLAYCRIAVEAHHGRIWVNSEEGQGSQFTFTLPLEDI